MSELTQLVSKLEESLQEFLDILECTKRKAKEQAEPFMGKREAAEFLNMSVVTLERRMAEKDGPPRYVDGGKVNFLRSELRAWRRRWRAGDQTGVA